MSKLTFEVTPFVGIGRACLGEDSAVIRAKLGPHRSGPGREAYLEGAIVVHYDRDDLADHIEVVGDVCTYRGIRLLGIHADEAMSELAKYGPVDESDGEFPYTCIYPSVGISLWRTVLPADDPDGDGRFETLSIWR